MIMPKGKKNTAKVTEPVKTPEQEAPQQAQNKEVPAEQSAPATETNAKPAGKAASSLSEDLQAAKRKLESMQKELLKSINDIGQVDAEQAEHMRYGAGQFMNQAQAFLEEVSVRIDEWAEKEKLVGVEMAKVNVAKQFITDKSESYEAESVAFQKLHDLDDKQFSLLLSKVRGE